MKMSNLEINPQNPDISSSQLAFILKFSVKSFQAFWTELLPACFSFQSFEESFAPPTSDINNRVRFKQVQSPLYLSFDFITMLRLQGFSQ